MVLTLHCNNTKRYNFILTERKGYRKRSVLRNLPPLERVGLRGKEFAPLAPLSTAQDAAEPFMPNQLAKLKCLDFLPRCFVEVRRKEP